MPPLPLKVRDSAAARAGPSGHAENWIEATRYLNYFEDTDTALLEFTSERVAETREVSENIYLDLDENGNLVSMTIEHAGENANIRDFAFEHQPKVNA